MGLGVMINGKYRPITPWAGSWAATVNSTPVPRPPDRRPRFAVAPPKRPSGPGPTRLDGSPGAS